MTDDETYYCGADTTSSPHDTCQREVAYEHARCPMHPITVLEAETVEIEPPEHSDLREQIREIQS
jgi:hypothetical protein